MAAWQVGAGLAFLSSVIAAFGDNLVKLSHTRNSSRLFALGWFLSLVVRTAAAASLPPRCNPTGLRHAPPKQRAGAMLGPSGRFGA